MESDAASDATGHNEDEGEEADDWRMLRLVYQHLPPNQRERDEHTRRGWDEPKSYPTRNFYQVKPISKILFRQGVFPVDIWDIEDPACVVLVDDFMGM